MYHIFMTLYIDMYKPHKKLNQYKIIDQMQSLFLRVKHQGIIIDMLQTVLSRRIIYTRVSKKYMSIIDKPRCVCETQMLPIMAHSKYSQGH